MTEDEIRELFCEMREEPVPAESLTRVRLAVAARRQRRFSWKIAGALAAAAAVVLAALMFRPVAQIRLPEPPPAMIALEQDVAVPAPLVRPVAEVKKIPKRRAKALRRAMSPPGTIIRIENSDDPDVVILLVD